MFFSSSVFAFSTINFSVFFVVDISPFATIYNLNEFPFPKAYSHLLQFTYKADLKITLLGQIYLKTAPKKEEENNNKNNQALLMT